MDSMQNQNRKESLRKSRKRKTMTHRKTSLKPFAATWYDIYKLQSSWATECESIIGTLTICACCGIVTMHHDGIISQRNDTSTEQLEVSTALSSTIFILACQQHGVHMVITKCRPCLANKDRNKYVVSLLPDYTKRVLNAKPLHLQLLSIVDTSISVSKTTTAIANGTLDRRSILDNPLVSWNDATLAQPSTRIDLTRSDIADVFAFNMLHNPLIQKYITIAEHPHPRTGLCILSKQSVERILEVHQESSPFDPMLQAQYENERGYSLLDNIVEPSRRQAFQRADQHEFACIILRHNNRLIERTATFRTDGLPTGTSACLDMTLEKAVFPFLFPLGQGAYDGGMYLSEYIKMRASTLFSVYTLHKPYILILYQLKQAVLIANTTSTTCLQRDIDNYKRANKNSSNEEVVRHILRYSVPASIPGSPSWHRRNLKDLITMVDVWGMPHFFLTFTADEVTSTRWDEINKLECIAKELNPEFSWKDCPIECAMLFHNRFHLFFNGYILGKAGCVGRVQHHVIRYEIQHRGSLHAHVILWLHEADVENATNEICAYIPSNDERCSSTQKLRALVLAKQLHRCRRACYISKSNSHGKCKYGFPYASRHDAEPAVDPETQRYIYYRPGHEHRNVVPYHPTLLLLWAAHMNIQRVTNSSISFYLLKYAMKAEPIGKLNIQTEDAKRLGLQDLDSNKQKLISAAILSKPVSPTEAALHCMQIPIVKRSESVEYIDSSPADIRQRKLTRTGNIIMHPIDLYCARPSSLDHLTFYDYHKNYSITKTRTASDPESTPRDAYGNIVHQHKRLVRFTDFHPGHQTEGFFFNTLLQRTCFRTESELISTQNSAQSYYIECQLRGLVANEEDLEMYITEYTQRNLLASDRTHQLMNMIIQKIPFIKDNPATFTSSPEGAERRASIASTRTKMLQLTKEFRTMPDSTLTTEQQAVYNQLMNATFGLHIVSGTPGSGKSFLIRYYSYNLIAKNKSVLLTASTGAAATRLCSLSTTVHYQFKIPVRAQQYPMQIQETDERYIAIREADAIIIDEMSMLTRTTFDIVVRQIVSVCQGSLLSPFNKKLVILFGDLAQLPPICNHQTEFCEQCHITSSSYWAHGQHHTLQTSVRHARDPPFLQFLQVIRHRFPTKQEIHECLHQCMIDEKDVLQFVDHKTSIICTHKEDVHNYNKQILHKYFVADQIYTVKVQTNANDEPALQTWLQDKNFHEVEEVAIGATAMITENIDLTIGAANGAMCKIDRIDTTNDMMISGIQVTIQATNQQLTLRRSKHQRKAFNSKWYHKSTFSLLLAYAITGHKSQGATVNQKVVLHIRSVFAHGLVYVMLSRVTERRNLRIVGLLDPTAFILIPYLTQ